MPTRTAIWSGRRGAGGLGWARWPNPSNRERRARGRRRPPYRLLQAALLVLRAGPALILLLLVVVVSLTTPIFFTSRNLGNVLAQTAVIAVLALGQLLVIVTPRHRPLGRLDGRALGRRRRDRLPARPLDARSSIARDARRPASPSALANGIVFVVGRVPHPFIVTLATLSIVRGLALWAAHGTLDLRACRASSTRSAAARSAGCRTRPSSSLGLALLAVVADDRTSSGDAGCTRSAATRRPRGAPASRSAAC